MKIIIEKDHFSRMKNDMNGNPIYYLPAFLTTEEKARKAFAHPYRGKKYGKGWVFSSYNLQNEIDIINS